MAARTAPPFRADHVGSLLRPHELLRGARGVRGGAHRRRASCARVEDEAIRDVVEDAGGRRPAVGHRRRVPARLLAHGLHLPAGRRHQGAGRPHGPVPQRGGRRSSSRRPRCRSPTGSALERDDLRRRLLLPAVADRAPRRRRSSRSPRRAWSTTAAVAAAIDPEASTPTWTSSGRTSRPPTPTRCARLGELGCTYLQFDDTSLAYLNDPHQREHVARARRGRRAPARDLHPPHQRGAGGPARGHGGHHAHVPRQLPLLLGGRGRLRLRGRGAVQRAGGRRLLPGVRRRALRAASSRCASCPRARWWCWAS